MKIFEWLAARWRRDAELIERLERRVRQLDELCARELAGVSAELTGVSTVLRALRQSADPTIVYLLPSSEPMSARSVRVEPGRTQGVTFHPDRDIDAGTWVVVTGPASVVSVRVGNLYQFSGSDFSGQVCKTQDVCRIGVQLHVELRG